MVRLCLPCNDPFFTAFATGFPQVLLGVGYSVCLLGKGLCIQFILKQFEDIFPCF